jgi:hypothetical protein
MKVYMTKYLRGVCMQRIRVLTGIVLMLSATIIYAPSLAIAADGEVSLRPDLERITHKRIFFGHQSVGMNILDGVKQLASMEGIPVRVVEVKTATEVESPMVGHTFIAEND